MHLPLKQKGSIAMRCPETQRLWSVKWFIVCLLGVGMVLSFSTGCQQELDAGQSCFGSYECKPGLICSTLQKVCVDPGGQTCQRNADCPGDYVCRFGLCLQKIQLLPCSLSEPCPTDQTCTNGFCAKDGEGKSCNADRECPEGLICDNRARSVCRPGIRCERNDECDFGFVCEDKRCIQEQSRQECTTNEECSDDEVCNAEGQCEQL